MPFTRFAAFLAVVSLVSAAIHRYLWVRLVRDPMWPDPWRQRTTWVLVALAASTLLALVLDRSLPRAVATPLAWTGMVWLGVMFYLLFFSLLVEPLRLFVRGESFARAAAVGVVAGAVLVCAYGALVVARGPEVVRVRVPLSRLDPRLDQFRIVALSDLHVGPTIGRSFLAKVVADANALDPDLVAITGDVVDGDVERLADEVAPLAGLRAKHGVFVVTGNHEYFSGADAWCAHLAKLGVRPLRNERVTIERSGASFDLAGVDDPVGESTGHGPDLARALEGRDGSRVVVLLSHRPRIVEEASRAGVDLVLASHTHGGQVQPFGLLTRLSEPLLAGLERFGPTWMYVGRGTGYWGPPMRVLAPPEITLVELAAARTP
jgi:uncharacterized protein